MCVNILHAPVLNTSGNGRIDIDTYEYMRLHLVFLHFLSLSPILSICFVYKSMNRVGCILFWIGFCSTFYDMAAITFIHISGSIYTRIRTELILQHYDYPWYLTFFSKSTGKVMFIFHCVICFSSIVLLRVIEHLIDDVGFTVPLIDKNVVAMITLWGLYFFKYKNWISI